MPPTVTHDREAETKQRSTGDGDQACDNNIIDTTAQPTAASLLTVSGSILSAIERSSAMTKLKLATGITMLASPCSIASIKKLTIKNTNIPESSEYRAFLRVNRKRFSRSLA